MNDTIKIVYKNYFDDQDTMNVPLIKEENTQLVFKEKQNDNNHIILFSNYYYYCQTVHIKEDNDDSIIDIINDVSYDTKIALKSGKVHKDIQCIIVIYDSENYKIYSNLRRLDDSKTDKKFKKNPIIDIEYNNSDINNHMSLDKYCIVSTCVEGQDIHFIHPKDGLFYIPEKIQEIHSQDNPTFSRIENIKKHSYEVSDFTIKNSIDPIDISFEQYEFLEEKIPEVLKDINNSANIINDNTTVDKVLYIVKINKMSENLLPIAQLIEQWRQIMLAY